jgi:hypothetical protein
LEVQALLASGAARAHDPNHDSSNL